MQYNPEDDPYQISEAEVEEVPQEQVSRLIKEARSIDDLGEAVHTVSSPGWKTLEFSVQTARDQTLRRVSRVTDLRALGYLQGLIDAYDGFLAMPRGVRLKFDQAVEAQARLVVSRDSLDEEG